MRVIHWRERGFEEALKRLLLGFHEIPAEIREGAEKIFDEVAAEGDAALFRWTEKLDRHQLTAKTVKVSTKEIAAAKKATPAAALAPMRVAARRIRAYHKLQADKGFVFDDGKGTTIAEEVLPLQSAGLYVPAGRAPLASTALMTGIPARLAGVPRIALCSPWPGGVMRAQVLVAAELAGAGEVYKIGGAQGIAALAAGTESVPRVDKIVGPGNMWGNAAKAIAAARGLCAIDGLAGPSEIVVAADDSAPPEFVAWDLLSQAEHGLDSSACLITTSLKLAQAVQALLLKFATGREGLHLAGVTGIVAPDLAELARFIDDIAPEHLEIIVREPERLAKKIHNAASIFLGPHSPVPAGDYLAGGNHVLPTGGAARFASPLSVRDFQKHRSVTRLSEKAMRSIARQVECFAGFEGLWAHGQSAHCRTVGGTSRVGGASRPRSSSRPRKGK